MEQDIGIVLNSVLFFYVKIQMKYTSPVFRKKLLVSFY